MSESSVSLDTIQQFALLHFEMEKRRLAERARMVADGGQVVDEASDSVFWMFPAPVTKDKGSKR